MGRGGAQVQRLNLNPFPEQSQDAILPGPRSPMARKRRLAHRGWFADYFPLGAHN